MEPVVAEVIPAKEFIDFVGTRPLVSLALLRSLTGRLRAGSTVAAVEFGGYDASHRVANLLVEMAEEHGVVETDGVRIDVPLTQDDLAGMIGASRESVAPPSLAFGQEACVHTRRRGITVVDVAVLRNYAV